MIVIEDLLSASSIMYLKKNIMDDQSIGSPRLGVLKIFNRLGVFIIFSH